MKKHRILSFILVLSFLLMVLHCPAVIAEDFDALAFPTAKGYARYANGFRGGRVIEVTNLNDSGEGSLRWALEEETGPRIVVFKVGGVIKLDSSIEIDGEHEDVYIAGQTAPGDGITLSRFPLKCTGAENVIIRHIRIRVGDSYGAGLDGIWLRNCNQLIVDHCSVSWAVGYSFVANSCDNISVQNCIFAESLYNSVYRGEFPDETSSHGTMICGNTVSFLNNLLINNADKNLMMSAYYTDNGFMGQADIKNNVVYNWYNGNAYGDIEKVQFNNNYFKKGEASITDTYFSLRRYTYGSNVQQKVYLSGNKLVDSSNQVILNSENDDQWKLVENTLANYTIEDAKSDAPMFESYFDVLTADEAYENVVKSVGATMPERDYIDKRYIDELVSGKSTYVGSKSGLPGIIDSQEDVGGYPDETNFKGGEAPLDTDHDGMPDEWETAHGLDPEYYYDACQIYLSDEGYTNIELYINELAGDPVKYSDNPKIQYMPVTPTPDITATPEVTLNPETTETPIVTETITPTVTPDVIYNEVGDVNGDSVIDADDALAVLKHAAKLDNLSDEEIIRADVESDDIIDAADALGILKIAAKIV